MFVDVIKILQFLIKESNNAHLKSHCSRGTLLQMESYNQQEIIRILLCERYPDNPIPEEINLEINKLIRWQNDNKLHTSVQSLTNNYNIANTTVSLWKGDITTLSGVTAIVNAANLALLGCFQPSHKCIDNVIHTAAGPELRQACYNLMQGKSEPTGSAKITPGFNLPAKYVIHTVGPIIRDGNVTEREQEQLANCYQSSLKALETVNDEKDKSIAFCCISTGLFAFPKELASTIAINTVQHYLETHPDSTIKHIVFNVFSDEDKEIYEKNLQSFSVDSSRISLKADDTINHNLNKAHSWLQEADCLIISAGAGLSASEGLDYTSKELFQREYKPFLKYGITSLYGTIGYPWPTKLDFWNFFVYHYINLYKKWGKTDTYQRLLNLSLRFEDSFVITSNADGFFVKNGFGKDRVLTVQGNYANIQCLKNCRFDAYRSMEEMVDKYPLTAKDQIPRCEYCGSEMTVFLRMGDYFNPAIVKNQRKNYNELISGIVRTNQKAVILELGVGLNTPSVLRWPNEDKVERYPENFKLIRVGTGPSSTAPLDDIENIVVINGDTKKVVQLLNK